MKKYDVIVFTGEVKTKDRLIEKGWRGDVVRSGSHLFVHVYKLNCIVELNQRQSQFVSLKGTDLREFE